MAEDDFTLMGLMEMDEKYFEKMLREKKREEKEEKEEVQE